MSVDNVQNLFIRMLQNIDRVQKVFNLLFSQKSEWHLWLHLYFNSYSIPTKNFKKRKKILLSYNILKLNLSRVSIETMFNTISLQTFTITTWEVFTQLKGT